MRDRDHDGLSDRYELKTSHTRVRRADTDHDGLKDGYEVRRSRTSPRRADTDRDGLSDRFELRRSKTNPRRRDTDGDLMSDGLELLLGRNPRARDLGSAVGPAPAGTDIIVVDPGPLPDPPPLPDLLPPETTITAGPSGTEQSATASFAFTSSESGSTFKCRLDGGAWTGCTSPKSYVGLAVGSHSFAVRATDAAGNTDLIPATRTWTVAEPDPGDTTAPDTSIASGPSGTQTTRGASFAFTSTESGSTFECRLDGGAWGACTSPKAYSSVADGSHTFDVRATDGAGNTDATPASRTWTVDATAPNTTIGSGPTGSVSTASASFAFSSSESGATFECRLDGGAYAACTSPKAYSGLADGSHTFNVRATDAAGNVEGSPAARTWTVDTAAPDTSISSGPSGTSTSASASFAFASTETGSTFQCRLDGGSWGACTSPKSYASLANGSHTFDVRATDAVGNQDASPASRSWVVAVADPDPGTNCMADPSACGFPDVENTGVLPGVARTTVNADVTLSTAGQVYENKTVNGTISVTAPNVTIRNVKVVMPKGGFYGIEAFDWSTRVANLLLQDVEVDMNGVLGASGIAYGNFTAQRVFIHNGSDCVSLTHNATVKDSLCVIGPDANGDAWPDSTSFCNGSEHFDGLQSDGGSGYVINHNTIRNPCDQTSAIIMSTNSNPISNVTITDNLMAGGGYTLYCNAGPDVPNEVVTGNRFAKSFWSKSGYWGPMTGCSQADTYSGNVWDDSGATLVAG